jgi:hypothetical protein
MLSALSMSVCVVQIGPQTSAVLVGRLYAQLPRVAYLLLAPLGGFDAVPQGFVRRQVCRFPWFGMALSRTKS